MAEKYWVRESSTRIFFYREPENLERDAVDEQITATQEILNSPDSVKALLAQAIPTVNSEKEFNDLFEDQLSDLADQRDYYSNQNVIVPQSLDAVDHRWMSPSEMSLGPGVIESVCGEEVGNEAANAIDGTRSTNWQHDFDHVHVLVIDLGYTKRIDGIRITLTATPGAPLQLTDVDVDIAKKVGNLDNPASRVGTGLVFTDPSDNDRDLTARNGRYIRLTINSTAHASNHITIREIEFRTRPRTFGL